MPSSESDLFAAVDGLLAQLDDDDLPPPAERVRLRKAARLSQTDLARLLRVKRDAVWRWETGQSEPRNPQRAAYARLLAGLVKRYPPPPEETEPAPAPAPTSALAPQPAVPEPDTVVAPIPPAAEGAPSSTAVADPDRDSAGDLVMGEALPCVRCGRPTPYRAAGRPQHLGGFCAVVAATTASPSASEAPPAPSGTSPSAPAFRSAVAPTPSTSAPAGPARAAARQPVKRSSTPRQQSAAAEPGTDARFAHGPLAVLDLADDGALLAHLADGRTLPCPAATLPALIAWTLESSGIGAPALHRHGKPADPLIVLTAGATDRLGLPPALEDREGLRLPPEHPVVKQLAKARWKLTRRGFGPWARIYRPADAGQRHCVQLAVLPWDALDTRAWGTAATLPPTELARLLGAYAARVLTPLGSTAVNGLELMTSVRPPTRAVRDEATGAWVSGPVLGSLTAPVDPAPPEAPEEHPLAQTRAAADVLNEEAYEWTRPVDLVDDAEIQLPYVVGLDVATAFLAAANRLTVGLGPAEHVDHPAFDKRLPGCWQVDLSGVAVDPRLPSPFTPSGRPPEGPGWYVTPTVAYALELGADVRPLQAWLRPDAGAYLDPWYARLRDAYLATMADLGVTPDLDGPAFLEAMSVHKDDPAGAALLSAIKATVKGGLGKLRERPQGRRYRVGDPWPALERPTWRPDIRAAVISAARVNMHRKMRKLAATTGQYPLAVLSDCVVYPAPGPSPIDVLPHTPDGRPLPGTFRLGVNPGFVKHEGTQPMAWALALLADGLNPARHIKGDGHDAVLLDGE